MSRIIKLAFPAMMCCLCIAMGSPATAQGFNRDRGEQSRDESWNYQGGYEPNPRAIVQQKAMERAAHRQSRLEAQYYSGEHRARPSVNPVLLIASTFPYNYVYGPPLVANDWGDTQISVLGDGNRATMRGIMGRRAGASEDSRPYVPR